eukprot:27597-Chlamydomonas_euryale.AAC.3
MPRTWGKNMSVELMPNSYVVFEPLPPARPGGPPRTRACMSMHTDAHIMWVVGKPAFGFGTGSRALEQGEGV